MSYERLPEPQFICRKMEGLKFVSLDGCVKRKRIGLRLNPSDPWWIGAECLGCEGALPIRSIFPTKPAAPIEPPLSIKPDTNDETWNFVPTKPHHCLTCHETDPQKFYRTRKTQCKKCDVAQSRIDALLRQEKLGKMTKMCPDCGKSRHVQRTKSSQPELLISQCNSCRMRPILAERRIQRELGLSD